MSAISRLRGAAIAVEMTHDCIERAAIAIATADDALRSVFPTAALEAALRRLTISRDLIAQICATLPDSAPLYAEAELAHQIEKTEHHNRRNASCPA